MSVMNIPGDSLIVHGYLGSLASVDITVSIPFFTADHFITVITHTHTHCKTSKSHNFTTLKLSFLIIRTDAPNTDF